MLKQNVDLQEKTVLITGAAGFIGANLVTKLLSSPLFVRIIGLDSVNDYYDPAIKEFR